MQSHDLPVDDLAEFAIQHLLSGKACAKELPMALALRWPARPALELVLAMSIAANSIETALSGVADREAAREAWRMAALLAVDVHVLGLGREPATVLASGLLDYWQHDGGSFL